MSGFSTLVLVVVLIVAIILDPALALALVPDPALAIDPALSPCPYPCYRPFPAFKSHQILQTATPIISVFEVQSYNRRSQIVTFRHHWGRGRVRKHRRMGTSDVGGAVSVGRVLLGLW